jgi:type VII secretion protein EccB
MAQESTTRLQASGYRFLVHRMEDALVCGDVRMLSDPLRAQSLSLTVGCVLAAIAVAVCAALAYLQPRANLGSAAIVMVRESGALHVRISDTWHPVLNLASARLITGASAEPELVGASAISAVKHGPSVGIPGAPTTIADPLDDAQWTLCEDETMTSTLFIGAASGPAAEGKSVLVTARGESAAMTYLLYDGRRARVDLRDHAVVRALKLDGVAPRSVSRVLLDAVPEAPAITAPVVAASGAPSALPGFPVGTVVRLTRAESAEFYVVLGRGVQRIGEVAADLIRFTQSTGRREIISVAPAVIGSAPVVHELAVTTFPDRGGVADAPAVCTQWTWQPSGAVNTAVLTGDSLPHRDAAVALAQADAAGPAIDTVVIEPGRNAYVRATGVSGEGGAAGPLYLISESGVAFGINGGDAAERLGLTQPPLPAPWPVLAHLPRGPELSVAAASVVRDGLGPPA